MAFGSVITVSGPYDTSGGYNAYRAVLYYAVDSQPTKVVFNSQGNVQSGVGHDSLSNFTLKLNNATKTSSAYLDSGANVKFANDDGITVNRTHAKQTKTLSAYAKSNGTWSGSSTASVTISIDPLASYAVTYNANGGSGAPAAGTKWYGETYTIPSTRPTRANYTFKGWATSSTATTATYQPSGTYTTNAALTLYAVWQLAATSPSITKLVAYRSDSSGNRIDDATADTTHVTIEYGWSVDSGTGASDRTIQFSLGGTPQTAITLSANSGTDSAVYENSLGIASTLAVSATLTDATHSLSATRSVTIPVVFKPFSMANKGLSAAFFGVASASWDKILKIFGRLAIDGRSVSYVEGAKGNAGLRFYKVATGSDQWNPCAVIQTKGGGSWTIGNYNGEELRFVYFTKSNIDSSTNTAGLNIALGNTKQSWHQAISGWTQLASSTNTTAMTYSLTGYSEVMFTATCTYAASDGQAFLGSVVLPIDGNHLTTTNRELYIGGSSNAQSASSYAGRAFMVIATTTKATPSLGLVDGVNRMSNTTWRVLAR